MALVQQMDAVLALIRAKFIPIIQKIKAGDCGAQKHRARPADAGRRVR